MNVRVVAATPEELDAHTADLLIVVLPADTAAWQLPAGLSALVNDAKAYGDLKLKAGAHLYLHRPAGVKAHRLLLCVAGGNDLQAVYAAVASAAGLARTSAAKIWSIAAGGVFGTVTAEQWTDVVVRAVSDRRYVYRHTKPSADSPYSMTRLQLLVASADVADARKGLRRGVAIAAGIDVARECANRPGNHCTPTHLAETARQLGAAHGVSVQVLDRKAVEKLKMGAFLSVARGSAEPLQFIVMRYDGAAKNDPPIVLVGKGVTFDSGGISIKPAAGMDEMKFDMGGAASVLGTFRAIAELKPRINLVGLIPACENMPSGTATKPGDVVTSMAGLTIEVLNTDAEGRLILCDALTYAERFKPAAVVDIATLTGACVVALGHHHSGLFSPDDGLADSLLAAGREGLDLAWRMPVDDAYAAGLKSSFADLANVGAREGGAITAAMFLKRFTTAYPWAHLDIAGTAWKSGATKGATGRPVSLLTAFVLARAGAPKRPSGAHADRGEAVAPTAKPKHARRSAAPHASV